MTFTISLSEQNKLFQADQNLCDIRPTDLGTSGCISRTVGNFLALWGLGNMLSCSTMHFFFQSKTEEEDYLGSFCTALSVIFKQTELEIFASFR